MSYWEGKRAVITGGSAGLGRVLAGALAARGARVAIIARKQAGLDAAAADIREQGGEVFAVAADVTNTDGLGHMADAVRSRLGGVDFFCHCAGRSMRGEAVATPIVTYRELWETNFLAAVRGVQVFADELRASRGHIVLVGSLASKVAPPYLGAYPSSKFPLAAFAQQLRFELGDKGVHTLLLCPGPIARQGEDASEPDGRYASSVGDLPAAALKPGGGAKLNAISPQRLAEKILGACERRQPELVVPGRAQLLFAVSQLSPRLGDWLLQKLISS